MRLLIVGDESIFIESLTSTLTERGCEVIWSATTAREAIQVAATESPDIVLLDAALSDEDAVSVGVSIIEASPDTRVIALTESGDAPMQRRAVEAGFHGVVTKDFSGGRLVGSILLVSAGQVVIPQEARGRLHPRGTDRADREILVAQLTEREREVLAMLASGMDARQIARSLTLSPNTVRSHIQNIRVKLKVRSRLEAVLFALRHGVVEPPADSASAAD